MCYYIEITFLYSNVGTLGFLVGAIINSITVKFLVMPPGTHPHAFLLGVYLGEEMLGHGKGILSTLVDNANNAL